MNLFQRAPLGGPPAAALLNLDNRPDGHDRRLRLPRRPGADAATGRTLALLGSPADGFAYRVLTGADPFADASWRAVAGPPRHPQLGGAARRRPARAAPS